MLNLLFFSKHGSLMRQFAIQQAILFFLGICFAFAALFFVRKIERAAEMAKIKNEISLAVERKGDFLRTWHSLGLQEAIDAEIAELKSKYPITTLKFYSRSDLPSSVGPNQIKLPSTEEPDFDTYIIVEFVMPSSLIQTFKDPNIYISSMAILILVIGNIIGGTRFFSSSVILPLSKLKSQLSLADGNQILTNPVHGEGEISDFIGDIIRITNENRELQMERDQLSTNVALGNLAAQVSHDIRSPLTALNLVVGTLKELPEDKRVLIRNATQRINDISNDLLNRAKKNQNTQVEQKKLNLKPIGAIPNLPENSVTSDEHGDSEVQLAPALVDVLVSEKRMQYREFVGLEIELDVDGAFGAFINVDSQELKRILSNLINNSFEAFKNGQGKIKVGVRFIDPKGKLVASPKADSKIEIYVKDNGQGIPGPILDKLGQRGVSFGKLGENNGNGLGIYHAFTTMQKFGGELKIESIPENGTTVRLIFPKASEPEWFAKEINLVNRRYLVSLDDDSSIHQIWEGRIHSLESANHSIVHFRYQSGEAFEQFVQRNGESLSQMLFLIDYELLNQPRTGLDLIEKLQIGAQSILVTSRHEELEIRRRASRLKLPLLPKALAGVIPLCVTET